MKYHEPSPVLTKAAPRCSAVTQFVAASMHPLGLEVLETAARKLCVSAAIGTDGRIREDRVSEVSTSDVS